MKLSSLPKEERPRERLINSGPDALSLSELLAICLGGGHIGGSALTLAQSLLATFGSIDRLAEASREELMAIKGIGPVKAVQLQALFTLVRRWPKKVGKAKYPLNSPDEAYTFAKTYVGQKKKEELMIMLRDCRGAIYHHEIVAVGSLTEVQAHPREILRPAILHAAYSFILVHTHPSGDPTPSKVDLRVTKALEMTSQMVGIRFDDHLILGGVSYVSLWEQGLFDRPVY